LLLYYRWVSWLEFLIYRVSNNYFIYNINYEIIINNIEISKKFIVEMITHRYRWHLRKFFYFFKKKNTTTSVQDSFSIFSKKNTTTSVRMIFFHWTATTYINLIDLWPKIKCTKWYFCKIVIIVTYGYFYY
jgi:hypothetical protein